MRWWTTTWTYIDLQGKVTPPRLCAGNQKCEQIAHHPVGLARFGWYIHNLI